ncbi:putative chromatin regulator PHD family [Medicago truncatula]|uniref:Putative chromatin regulator PHD family n=1 Tax=Medicago truncatula TaxID=3880 RepID=A0A072U822_MEDTR|nr:BRCT domain-containing protein At4g02110 isoform X2 [Medicago truncatula]KEH25278.1 zinc finger, C3HC4 type (RING finger) protein, putative [Medicago truncatula]RHN50372.1 putative chromatin regulator PHD family [Medicago truncatula]
MDRVVATVSGYRELERFNLIKLISRSGASYVGDMSKSITHLVCWKFEGKKYDIARKLKIYVVNHRWVEDCIKEGRRVPEDSYTLQSGQEVGPLVMEVPVNVQASTLSKNKVVRGRSCDIVSERQNTDFSSGVCGIPVLEDSSLLKQHGESSSYPPRLSRKGKRNRGNDVSTTGRHSHKGRRVVKNDGEVTFAPIILDLSTDDQLCEIDRQDTEAAVTSTLSRHVNIDNIQENSEGLDAGLSSQSRTIGGSSDGIEQSRDSNHISTLRNSTLFIEDPLPLTQTSVDLCSSAAEKFSDGDVVDNFDDSPTSNELSCVICWTDFSSTRGILECGHRFCFSCIQGWVDCRKAMGKVSNCPLCKASIMKIMKVEHADTTDQKAYSQTIPCDYTSSDVFIPIDQEFPDNSLEAGACVICGGREPEDLLENCDVCRCRRIHSYCMDPPLRPWTCTSCKELRMLYRNRLY